MSRAVELVEEVRRRGANLHHDGDDLVANGDGFPPDLVAELRDHKSNILAALRDEETERQRTIEAAVETLFSERPEFSERRVGQVACTLYFNRYVDFPVKDHEVAAVLHERSVVAMTEETA